MTGYDRVFLMVIFWALNNDHEAAKLPLTILVIGAYFVAIWNGKDARR